MHSFTNEQSQALSNFNYGLCCDVDDTPKNGICDNECDNYFWLCVQPYDTVRSGVCPFGVYTTSVVGGDDIDFQPYMETELSPGVPNPLIFNGTVWPMVSHTIHAYVL